MQTFPGVFNVVTPRKPSETGEPEPHIQPSQGRGSQRRLCGGLRRVWMGPLFGKKADARAGYSFHGIQVTRFGLGGTNPFGVALPVQVDR